MFFTKFNKSILNFIYGRKVKVSVIIPIYNVEKYIFQCIDSVIQQTLKDIEIILVDDGSPDKCPQIVDLYDKQDYRVRVIHKSNGGLSSARNAGLKIAKGKYIYYLDADDYIESNSLEKLYSMAELNNVDMIVFNADAFLDFRNKDDFTLQSKANAYKEYYHRSNKYGIGIMTGADLFCKMKMNGEHRSAVWLQLTRREHILVNNLTFYEGIIHEDNLYTMKSMLLATRMMFLPQILYYRRVRDNSIMTKKEGSDNFYGYFITYCEALKFINKYNFSTSVKTEALKEIESYKKQFVRLWKLLSDSEKRKFMNGLNSDQIKIADENLK